MNAIDRELAAPLLGPSIELAVYDDPAPIADLWRGLEAEAGTPYQRLDWVQAWFATLGRAEGARARIVVGREPGGMISFLLPLAVLRCGPVRIAGAVGGRHANLHAPLWRPGRRFGDPASFARRIAGAVGADALALPFSPRRCGGATNPLVDMQAAASAERVHVLALDASGEETLARTLSRDARKKLRQKERWLAEIGPVAFGQARSAAEAGAAIDAMAAHKAERRRATGLPNPLEDRATRDFLLAAATAGLDRGTPAVELYALRAGERVVAAFAGATDGTRLCGMMNSFASDDPALARCSPGDLMLARLVADQCRRGREALDLGVGEARYKDAFCDGHDELVDLLVPVTPLGAAYAAAAGLARAGKDRIKASPRAWGLVRRLRQAAAREG